MLVGALPLPSSRCFIIIVSVPVRFSYILNKFIIFCKFYRIRHFAGPVIYNTHGFVEKNRDLLPREVSRAMHRCDHPLMHSLFPEGNPKRYSVKRPVSTATQLQVALKALLKSLTSRHSNYIRCLKPNEMKQPRVFEISLIQHQVKLNLY